MIFTKGDSTYNPYDFEAMNRMAKSSEMHINTIKEFQKEVVSNKFEIYKMITDFHKMLTDFNKIKH